MLHNCTSFFPVSDRWYNFVQQVAQQFQDSSTDQDLFFGTLLELALTFEHED